MLKVVGASWLQTKVSSYLLAGIGILAIVALFIGEIERIEDDNTYAATVYWSVKGGFRIDFWGQGNELAEVPRGVARAYYKPDVTPKTGWSAIEIETSDGAWPDWVQAYSAGLLEGALTWQLIHWHWQNTIEARCYKKADDCKRIRDLLTSNMEEVRRRGIRNQDDPLWHHINLFYHQVDGLWTGWNHAVKRSRSEIEISRIDFIWLNAMNDVPTMERMLNISSGVELGQDLPGLAASFIRLVPDSWDQDNIREKVIMGHNSAGSYNIMLRLLKRYKFNYHSKIIPKSPLAPGNSVVFSGYPAAVSSQDHLYTIAGPAGSKHHLAITGTSINIFTNDLWEKVNLFDHVLIGPRVMAANRLAVDGFAWSRLLSRVNSGTAMSQWSVVTLSKLAKLNATQTAASSVATPTPDHSLYRYIHSFIDGNMTSHPNLRKIMRRRVWPIGGPGLLWVVEQIPGHTHAADQSNVLRAKGYWADYGIPHYQDMRELSGIKNMELQHGNIYSLSKSPRAALFKKGFETAIDIDSVTSLMRSNHYENEDEGKDAQVTPAPEGAEEIEPEDIVTDSKEVKQIIQSLETVKSHVESKDVDGVASILTQQEQSDITAQVNEILQQLSTLQSSSEESRSESESSEHLNLESEEEDDEDRSGEEGSWLGLGARGDLRGWIGEERYGRLPLGVIDTKVFTGTIDGFGEFEATSGPSFSPALEKSIESLLTPATRKKAQFGLAALLKKIRQSNLRFVSSSSEEEEDEGEVSSTEQGEPLNLEEALEHVVNTNIQVDPPKPFSVLPFQWSKSNFTNAHHVGQPDLWEFDPIKPTWVW